MKKYSIPFFKSPFVFRKARRLVIKSRIEQMRSFYAKTFGKQSNLLLFIVLGILSLTGCKFQQSDLLLNEHQVVDAVLLKDPVASEIANRFDASCGVSNIDINNTDKGVFFMRFLLHGHYAVEYYVDIELVDNKEGINVEVNKKSAFMQIHTITSIDAGGRSANFGGTIKLLSNDLDDLMINNFNFESIGIHNKNTPIPNIDLYYSKLSTNIQK